MRIEVISAAKSVHSVKPRRGTKYRIFSPLPQVQVVVVVVPGIVGNALYVVCLFPYSLSRLAASPRVPPRSGGVIPDVRRELASYCWEEYPSVRCSLLPRA